jgi:16S rRNA processing protein RimM
MASDDSPTSDVASGHIAIGRILAPHALRGEVKVQPLTARAEHFAAGRTVWIEDASLEVEAVRRQRAFVFLKLSGVDSIEAAEKLRGRILSLPEAELEPLSEDEYYAYEIVGLEVYDRDGAHLGKVTGLFPTGSNDVYVVRGPLGEILLPAIDDVILEVDVPGGKMVVSLMEGMLPS